MELMEDLQDMCPDYYNNNYNWLHNLLDKEKQQIIDAFVLSRTSDGCNWNKLDSEETANGYYNETFKR